MLYDVVSTFFKILACLRCVRGESTVREAEGRSHLHIMYIPLPVTGMYVPYIAAKVVCDVPYR
jgi:hypothetical protein